MKKVFIVLICLLQLMKMTLFHLIIEQNNDLMNFNHQTSLELGNNPKSGP
jgi:hypothetical protein